MKLVIILVVFLLLAACQKKEELSHSTEESIVIEETMKTTSETTFLAPTTVIPETTVISTAEEAISPTKKVILDVPHYHQKVWYYCAPTTVSMMLATRGIVVDQYVLAEEMGTYEPYGTHNRDAIRILNKHLVGKEYPSVQETGYQLVEVNDISDETKELFEQRVLKNVNDGYPMYYTMDVSKVYPGKTGEHNVIGIGYELNEKGTHIEWLYYYDPAQLLGYNPIGTIKRISPEQLLTAMLSCGERNYAY